MTALNTRGGPRRRSLSELYYGVAEILGFTSTTAEATLKRSYAADLLVRPSDYPRSVDLSDAQELAADAVIVFASTPSISKTAASYERNKDLFCTSLSWPTTKTAEWPTREFDPPKAIYLKSMIIHALSGHLETPMLSISQVLPRASVFVRLPSEGGMPARDVFYLFGLEDQFSPVDLTFEIRKPALDAIRDLIRRIAS